MKKKKEPLVRGSRFKHEQHTSTFYKEVTAPNQNIQQPFRISDSRWVIGKFKGNKIEDTPKHYIKWILNNFNHLSSTHKSILTKILI